MKELHKYALYFAWLLAFSGFLISVYYAEVLQVEPCRLCWYQRMAIVPLALFLGIAAYRSERKLALYSLPFALFGALVALYQSLLRVFPYFHSPYLCGSGQCNIGGVPPYLSLLGFIAIAALIWNGRRK